MNSFEWFQTLYGDASNGWITISHKRDSGSAQDPEDPFLTNWHHVSALDQAAADADNLAKEKNVYFGLGLRRSSLGNRQRGSVADVVMLPGVWIEIDVAGGTHGSTKKRYFPSKDSVLEFLEQGLPLKPSALVDSGGGIHGYWLFKEPWLLDPDDIEYAAAVVRGWQGYVRSRTSHDIDSTHDLARVLRVPGTFNRKNGDEKTVELLYCNDKRYNPSDFDEWLDMGAASKVPLPTVSTASGMEPPVEKYQALLEADKKFRQTMERNRPDAKNWKDQSDSSYCLSAATIAAHAGWSDQEITRLLVYWREKHGSVPKPAGWYALTLQAARSGQGWTGGKDVQTEVLARLEESPEKDEKLANLSELLGFEIQRVIKYHCVDEQNMTVDPWYKIETAKGNMEVPNSSVMRSYKLFGDLVYGHLGHNIVMPSKEWPKVAQAFLDVMIVEESPTETSPYNEIAEVVREYAERKGRTDDPVSAHDSNLILERNGELWFSLGPFSDWARIRKGMRAGPRNIPKLLIGAGAERIVIHNLLRDGKRTSLTFWSVPRAYIGNSIKGSD